MDFRGGETGIKPEETQLVSIPQRDLDGFQEGCSFLPSAIYCFNPSKGFRWISGKPLANLRLGRTGFNPSKGFRWISG